jgi:hypothetical protein
VAVVPPKQRGVLLTLYNSTCMYPDVSTCIPNNTRYELLPLQLQGTHTTVHERYIQLDSASAMYNNVVRFN